MGGGVSKEEYDAQNQAVNDLKTALAEGRGDTEQISKQLSEATEQSQRLEDKLAKELSDQPEGAKEDLQRESIEVHGLDSSKFNVLLYGTVSAGKSTTGNFIVGLKAREGGFPTGQTPVHKDSASDPRACRRAELLGVVVYDVEGSGTEGHEAKKMVKERGPAGFDMVLVNINEAVMNEDRAMIRFCNVMGIPWRLVKGQMDIAVSKEGQDEDAEEEDGITEEKVNAVRATFFKHARDTLNERKVVLEANMLLFVDALHQKQRKFDEDELIACIAQQAQAVGKLSQDAS